MAGRHHDAAVGAQVRGREVDHLGAAEADVQHLDARVGQAANHGIGKLVACQPHVTADNHGLRIQKCAGGVANAVANIGVQFVGDLPTNVVGFETGYFHQVFVPSRP